MPQQEAPPQEGLPSIDDIIKDDKAGAGAGVPPPPPTPPAAIDPETKARIEEELRTQLRAEVKDAPRVGGVYRDKPEAFFGPVVAALVASGVKGPSLKVQAVQAYYTTLELVDWVREGKADGAWVVERKAKDLKSEWKRLDTLAQEKKQEHDVAERQLLTMKGYDASRPAMIQKIEDLKAAYEKAQVDSIETLAKLSTVESERRGV